VIKNFDVLDYDPLFSDVHCALQFSFSVDICLLSAENLQLGAGSGAAGLFIGSLCFGLWSLMLGTMAC
jgi:hypothetical protein